MEDAHHTLIREPGPGESVTRSSPITQFFSLQAVDFSELKEQPIGNDVEEDQIIKEAKELAQGRDFQSARNLAQNVLKSNPTNVSCVKLLAEIRAYRLLTLLLNARPWRSRCTHRNVSPDSSGERLLAASCLGKNTTQWTEQWSTVFRCSGALLTNVCAHTF